jgi:hypothetical protein
MAFPPGTIVYDVASNANYISSEGDVKDYDHAARVAVDRLKKANEQPATDRPPNSVPWLIALNLLLIFVFVALWCWKRK